MNTQRIYSQTNNNTDEYSKDLLSNKSQHWWILKGFTLKQITTLMNTQRIYSQTNHNTDEYSKDLLSNKSQHWWILKGFTLKLEKIQNNCWPCDKRVGPYNHAMSLTNDEISLSWCFLSIDCGLAWLAPSPLCWTTYEGAWSYICYQCVTNRMLTGYTHSDTMTVGIISWWNFVLNMNNTTRHERSQSD